ncbi:DNA-binding protein [Acinetobacter haemolyticus]|uniref:DNA-binding protein n=1 Tax=Acinetobacter haemolyticus TaxID=29430 RepID=UPI001298771C|nr:DNA-binding protein [Acinetobacter haemolyticus]MQZ31085.1 DNA-binding protein [Acinetobacter haemolyticus]
MGAFKYTITVESDAPPQILLGQNLGGAIVTKLEQEKQELVSAAELAKTYNLSVSTIREKLISINQGTGGKHMYNPELAHQILTKNESNKRGRKRAN